MQSQSHIQTIDPNHLPSKDHSIAGLFTGTGFSLFGFLMLIVLLA
ncbi:MAG: hypothetical protein NW220_04350 [Leptolyngbyaceae cyanobacterium bins.349]|nr:hypothetical protein [Leptolyngbyaceae cyanobacterium bins.349]